MQKHSCNLEPHVYIDLEKLEFIDDSISALKHALRVLFGIESVLKGTSDLCL